MERMVLVYIDLESQPHLVGRLFSRYLRGRETASFEYDHSWLSHPESFALEPFLSLDKGKHHTPHNKSLFGAFGDSSPDRWGRILMRRSEQRISEFKNKEPRTLLELDYLLMVNDEARQGALRFKRNKEDPFLAPNSAQVIPPLLDLPHLLSASQRIVEATDQDDDLRLLLAPGSSLGGARPKSTVRDKDGSLSIAKFPHPTDEIRVEAWESVALKLASKSGIEIPEHRLEEISGRPVLLLKRFDRSPEGHRIPFLSAMSFLSANDNEVRSYIEISDIITRYGANPKHDREQLWRRIVFNVLISNTDDHLRNHGFLYQRGSGWVLSPAYDLNPVPIDIKPRILSTAIGLDDQRACLDIAFEHASYFGISLKRGKEIVLDVSSAVSIWRQVASKQGISKQEIERMSSAFEHKDSRRSY